MLWAVLAAALLADPQVLLDSGDVRGFWSGEVKISREPWPEELR